MRKKRLSVSLLLGSFLGAAAAGFAPAFFLARKPEDPVACVALTGLLFLALYLGGILGMRVAMALPLKYKVKKEGRALVTVLMAVLITLSGCIGQALFCVEEKITIPADGATPVDMVLLLDVSGSMEKNGSSKNRTEAAIQLVESLTADTRLGAVSFASRVLDSTGLLAMDSAGQTALIDFIAAADSVGDTDLDDVIAEARSILEQEGRGDSVKAIVLLTDGEGSIDSSVQNSITDAGILLFTVRITDSPSSAAGEELAAFAGSTGGADLVLKPTGGTIDATDMLKELQSALGAAQDAETSLRMGTRLLVSETNVNAWRFSVRFLIFALFALFASLGYFGRIRVGGALMSLLSALLSNLLVTPAREESVAWFLVMALFLGTAFVCLQVEETLPESGKGGAVDV